MIRTHYDNLQISHRASEEVIKGAFKFLSQKWHPDKQPPEMREESERNMKLINEAYQVLINPITRKEHDNWIKEQEASQTTSKQSNFDTENKQETSNQQNRKLSLETREYYALAIARRNWGLNLIVGYFAALFLTVILYVIYGIYIGDWKKASEFLDLHRTGIAIFQLILTIIIAKDEISKDTARLLDKHDDNVLSYIYNQSAYLKHALSAVVFLITAVVILGVLVMVADGKKEATPQKQNLTDTEHASSSTQAISQINPSQAPKITNQEITPPKFSDYPAVSEYAGESANLILDTQETIDYQTRLSDAFQQAPEFAGEYVVASWGCGTSCTVTSFVNKRTGKLLNESFGGESGPFIVKYKLDSNLLVAQGPVIDDQEKEIGYAAYFYVLENDNLKLIKTIPISKSNELPS